MRPAALFKRIIGPVRALLLLLILPAYLLGCDRPKPPNEPPKTVTYYQNIAPIISAQCLTCHHPNGSAPFSLASLEDVKKHAAQIVRVTKSRFMPP